MAKRKIKKKEKELILVNTNALLDATGWTIEKLLLDVFGLTKEKANSIIEKIQK